MAIVETRHARGGTLVLGGGFAGSYVARLLGKRGATIVSEENFMLYTPLLPEAASGSLEPRYPRTERSRQLYENDHIIHASRAAELAPRLLELIDPLIGRPGARDVARAGRALLELGRAALARHGDRRFRTCNTGSEDLPAASFHPQL